MLNPADYAVLFVTPHEGPADKVIKSFTLAYLGTLRRRVERAFATRALAIPRFPDPSSSSFSAHAWRPECGLAMASLQRDGLDAAALQLGLAYAGMGQEVELSSSIKERIRLFFEGHLFEVTGETTLAASDDGVVIDMDDGRCRVAFHRRDSGEWALKAEASACPVLNWAPIPGAEGPGYIVHSTRKLSRGVSYQWPRHDEALSTPSGDDLELSRKASQGIRATQAFVRQYAPNFAAWNERLSAGYLLCDTGDTSYLHSESSLAQPGMIFLGNNDCPKLCHGAVLAHENAHQHMHLYGLLAPLSNGDDARLYYSPLRRQERPIDKILVAAHATVNMLLYYAEARSNGAPIEGWYLDQARFHLDGFNQMKEPLSNSPGLTPAGRSFFEEMMAAVDATDLSWVP